MKPTIYLVGALTENVATHKWRDEASARLGAYFNIINPAGSAYDKKLIERANGDPVVFYRWVKQEHSHLLLPKSLRSVERSDVLLVNFSIEPVGRPMIGSIMEIAWAWQLNKAIVAIKGDGFYSIHPMIVRAVHAWVKDVEDACDTITTFFSKE